MIVLPSGVTQRSQVADCMHRQHQFLDGIGLVALEARSGRGRDLDHAILDRDAGTDLAAAAALLTLDRIGRFGAFVHAAGLDVRAAFQAFQAGDLFALLGDTLFQFRYFAR